MLNNIKQFLESVGRYLPTSTKKNHVEALLNEKWTISIVLPNVSLFAGEKSKTSSRHL